MTRQTTQPKILIVDIETAPVLGYVWGLWQQNLGLEQIVEDWFILSFAAKWLGQNKIFYHDQSKSPDLEDDLSILEKLWKLLDEADIVVAHNGKKFDVKKINTRFVLKGLGVPSPYKVVDTLIIAKQNFAFTSNKLAFLTEKLCQTQKLNHGQFPGFTLWKELMKGNRKAWKECKEYNIVDVLSLEELYLKLRPWDKFHPNLGVYDPKPGHQCSKCQSHNLSPRGFTYTQVGKYQRYRCDDCGGWSRDRKTHSVAEKREFLLTTAI